MGISQGESFSVVIRVDDNMVDHLQVVNHGSALKIDLKPNRDYSIGGVDMEAQVTMAELVGLGLSGSAEDLTIDVDGGSHAKLADLAVVDAKGGSEATVNPSGIMDAVASGGSHVTYLGSPTLGTIDTDSTSTVKQK